MNELIKRITEKTGVSEDQAHKAAQTVIEFLKQKLPSNLAGQLDQVLGSEQSGGIGQKVGSLLGR